MKILLIPIVSIIGLSCNSYNDKMNKFLSEKKQIENRIDSNQQKDKRFRDVTGYNEMDDSLALHKTYPSPELVDSINYIKDDNEFLKTRLDKVNYSIDSLQKLK